MIAALRRLQAVHEPHDLPEQLAAFGIADGIGQGSRSPQFLFPPNIFMGLGIMPMGFEPPESRLSWPPK